jgi:hypothetical protein
MMFNLQVIMIVCLFLLIGCLCLSIALCLARYFMQRRISIGSLFVGLKPKLWMTAGLGAFFAIFYTGIILGVSHWFDPETRLAIFQMAYRNPMYFVYGGLAIFVLFSLAVLAVRRLIKRLYNSYK